MKKISHYSLTVFGILLIFLGIICFLFPPIPGWLIILLGILLIGRRTKFGQWIYNKLPNFLKKHLGKN